MGGDPWEHLWYTTTWMMNNLPPIEDYHYFEILKERERQYQADLEFYNISEYDDDLYFNYNNIDNDYYEDNYNENRYSDSSSESEYDDSEYI
jgi:hypothetical protein